MLIFLAEGRKVVLFVTE